MKKILITSALALLIALAFLVLRQKSKPFNIEEYIIGQTTNEIISKKYQPAMLYRTSGDGNIYHSGCGTIVTGLSGKIFFITSEHLFEKSLGTQYFFVRSLRPFEFGLKSDQGISAILASGQEIVPHGLVSTKDIVLCEIGKPKPIAGFSVFSAGTGGMDDRGGDMMTVKSKFELRSLTSGKAYQVVLMSKKTENTSILFIAYATHPGESGTGFVGSKGELYILKGEIMDLATFPDLLDTYKMFGIQSDAKLAILIGPFDIEPRQ